MTRSCLLALALLSLAAPAIAADGNRLTYLDEFCDPYYPHRDFPKLTTPQWIGDQDVECVVVLAIDDMREPEKYETYLRPILDRLKQIDGRAPVSIMSCQADPKSERVQQWLKEGLSIEVHTFDHPCPCLAGGDFAKAKGTYDKCVDLMSSIPGNRPVAFRMPCCDSLNTPSPRFWMEAFNKTTEQGNYLTIDSSVFNIITANDPSLPKEITRNEQGEERFRRYVPFKSFVNTIEDYPYPYVISKLCWQFPCVVPSDWSAQHVQKPNNPDTVRDLKLALDACVIKQGVYNLVFHPHGWIRNDQIVELIDHAVSKHGKKIKFLNFRECDERLRKNLLFGQALRNAKGADNGVRIFDANNDGYMDVILGNGIQSRTRVWDPKNRSFSDSSFPEDFDPSGPRFGVLLADGRASMVGKRGSVWHFTGDSWKEIPARFPVLQTNPDKLRARWDTGVRLRDIDHDGRSECVIGEGIYQWDSGKKWWAIARVKSPAQMIHWATNELRADAGLRFIDLDGDNDDDILVANEKQQGVWLFESFDKGWREVKLPGGHTIPLITRNGTNNGAFFHSKHLWWQNEDTNRLSDHVDRRSFAALLGKDDDTNPKRERGSSSAPQPGDSTPGKAKPTITPTDRKSAEGQEATEERIKDFGAAKSPEEALKTIVVKKGFRVELVAAEPLIVDPVAFDWGPDGRLWVVEMRDYPRGIDDQGKPGGRVKVLTDTDGDGRYDEAKLFLDDLPFPTGIKVWRKGALVTAAPEILYAEDTDGDGKADVKKPLYRGFGEGNQQHRVNGLRWGLDGWLYLGNGDSAGKIESLQQKGREALDISGRDLRIHPDSGDMEALTGQTQFSLAFDDFGNRFGGNNSNPVWHYLLEDYYLRRNPHFKPPTLTKQISVTPGNAPIFPRSKTVTRFNDYGTANRFTSACGIEIYRDTYLGKEYYGNSFVCEPVHNLVHREIVERDGLSFKSRRADDEKESEFLASTDNWFRPVMARTGPDGALYVADTYRMVIEHPTWIPEDWQKKLDLRAGSDKGRIYRIVREDEAPKKLAPLDKLALPLLVAELESTNGTRRDMVQQVLIWNKDKAAAGLLQKLLSRKDASSIQAFWTLAELKALRTYDVLAALDSRPEMQMAAARVAAIYFPGDRDLRSQLCKLANDTDALVQKEAALALHHWRGFSVAEALATIAKKHVDDPVMVAAVFTSIDANKLDAGFWEELEKNEKAAAKLEDAVNVIARESGDGRTFPSAYAKRLRGGVDAILQDTNSKDVEQIRRLSQLFDKLTSSDDFSLRLSESNAKAIAKLTDRAREIVADDKASTADRIVAARLLLKQDVWLYSQKDRRADYGAVPAILTKDIPPELQTTLWEGIRGAKSFPLDSLLYEQWIDRPQAYRHNLLDALLANKEATGTLLKLLEGNRLAPADVDATRLQALVNHPDKQVAARARKLTQTLTLSDRGKLVEQFGDVLTMRGDVARGRAAFRKRCTACHKQEGEGRQIGPDLASLTDKSPKALLTAMLDPNRAVEAKFLEFLVITTGGQLISGVVTSETGTSLTLISADGKEHTILRKEIELLSSNKKSLMPEGLERDLTKQEFADVIAYLQQTAVPPKAFDGNAPALVKANDVGVLELSATSARIYGPKIVYEAKYKNLGWWQTPEDGAEWSLQVPAAGKYRVTIDYACAESAAGDTLQLAIGGRTLLYKVESTGTWDDYAQKVVGTVELEGGPAEASARSSGPVTSALIDLRGVKLEPVK